MTLRSGAFSAALIAAALAVTGCGGGGGKEAREVGKKTIAGKVEPPTKTTITDADLAKFPGDTPQHAFLQFWSNAQFQSWDGMASFYNDDLAHFIGIDRLVEALKTQAALYR